MFCVLQSYKSNTVFFIIFLNARYNGVLSIGSLIAVFNTNTIEDYMNGVHIIVLNEQSILVLPMNHSPIHMCNTFRGKLIERYFHPTR